MSGALLPRADAPAPLASRGRPLRVLISEPNAGEGDSAYLPYVWAVLKSHWERQGGERGSVRWLDPLYRPDAIRRELEELPPGDGPDVLGLSCYVWNWDLQLEIARWAKRRDPACLVVAGGPHPDLKDGRFFARYADVDVVVERDGEIPFALILERTLAGRRDFESIPGLHLRRPGRVGDEEPAALFTGPASVPTLFAHSPYLDQRETYLRLSSRHRGRWLSATLETTRGCPYSCSFCDWGSSTQSRVRRFELARVEQEIGFLAELGVDFVFLADANFGILPRDLEVAERFAAVRRTQGRPGFLYYSAAKNDSRRAVEIARRLHSAGLTRAHVLAVQHTDQAVLAATERSNIPPERYRELVAALAESGVPVEAQLILGIPGDDREKWRDCLAELMEWGVHEHFAVFPYCLLPNAPAAAPDFLAEWRLETVERSLTAGSRRRLDAGGGLTKTRVVVGSRTYDRADWIDMGVFATFVQALHNRALTRLPALYLRHVHGVSYRELYTAVIDDHAARDETLAPLREGVRRHFADFLAQPGATNEMTLDALPYDYSVDASRWLFVGICQRLGAFYAGLERFLAARFPAAPGLASALACQRALVILPDYDPAEGGGFLLDRDWPAFQRAAAGRSGSERIEEPVPFPAPRRASIVEQRNPAGNPLDFGRGSTAERWARWVELTVSGQNSAAFSNFGAPQVASG